MYPSTVFSLGHLAQGRPLSPSCTAKYWLISVYSVMEKVRKFLWPLFTTDFFLYSHRQEPFRLRWSTSWPVRNPDQGNPRKFRWQSSYHRRGKYIAVRGELRIAHNSDDRPTCFTEEEVVERRATISSRPPLSTPSLPRCRTSQVKTDVFSYSDTRTRCWKCSRYEGHSRVLGTFI